MIQFSCPNCDEKFKVDDRHAGRKAKCSACEQSILVPEKTKVENYLDPELNGSLPTNTIAAPESSVGFFGNKFERIDGLVVKVESRVASIGTKGVGAGFSVPIEDLGVSIGTGLAGSKSKVEHDSVIWVKKEDQKETRFVFNGEIFPCREGNRIAIGLIGKGILVARNYSTNQKVIVNKPESFYEINPPEFRLKFYGMLAAFFLLWFFLLTTMLARATPYGTDKSPMTQAIDFLLTCFVCFSPLIMPVVIYIFVSKNSRRYYRLEYAKQSTELNDIIRNF